MALICRRSGKKTAYSSKACRASDTDPGRQPGSTADRLTEAEASDSETPNPLVTGLTTLPVQPHSNDRQQGSAANRLTQQLEVGRIAAHLHDAPNQSTDRIPAAQIQLRSTGRAPVAASVTPFNRPSTGLNASRIQGLQRRQVVYCDPMRILEGVTLARRELGRGSFGIVVPGK